MPPKRAVKSSSNKRVHFSGVDVFNDDVDPPVRRTSQRNAAKEEKKVVSYVEVDEDEDDAVKYEIAKVLKNDGSVQTTTVETVNTLSCINCGMVFVDAKQLCDHLYKFHKISKPPCPKCNKSFSRKVLLDRHLQRSCLTEQSEKFSCSICSKQFSRRDNLTQHLKKHSGEVNRIKRYECKICSKMFFTPSHLEIHNRIHTGERPFDCNFCSKKFSNSGALKKHTRTHTGEKPFQCEQCNMSFSLKGTLNRHIKIHYGIRPHKCDYCGKEFIQSGGLKAHLFFHTGKNGFRCDICDRQFNRKARLEMHKKYVHEKVKPFACSECNKSFTRKEDLNRHQVLHTGEKPFVCQYCKKSFAIKGSLNVHMLTHRKEEPRACKKCGHAFIRKDCLVRHIRKMHRDQVDVLMMQHDLIENSLQLIIENEGDLVIDFELINGKISNDKLCDAIRELLQFVVDHTLLKKFGWPNTPVDSLLESLIKQCDCEPVRHEDYTYYDRLRENVKLLFTVVIEDDSLKQTLNNTTVDELILTVIMEAKEC